MAVEARHHQMTEFPSQLISTRGNFVKTTNPVPFDVYGNPQSGVVELPYSNGTDSGLTYNFPPVVAPTVVATRKRPRDPFVDLDQAFTSSSVNQKTKFYSPAGELSSFVGNDVVFQIQQHQSEIDQYIAEHNHKVRVELEERRKRQSRMLVSAIQEGVTRKLREKDEELLRMGKLNWALQERVKALYVENQLWRDLAQTNEATVNSLRSDLEAVLAHVNEDRLGGTTPAAPIAVEDDAESSCGSSGAGPSPGACRNCGKGESSVLVLPCRHLCLCSVCGSSSVGTCPVCDSLATASVFVNMS